MERIGIRELRRDATRWLARVAAGETIGITSHGRLVAMLSPPAGASARNRLLAGRLIPASRSLASVQPLPARAGQRPLSEELAELRDEER